MGLSLFRKGWMPNGPTSKHNISEGLISFPTWSLQFEAADFEKETLTAVTEARASAFNAMQAVGNGTGSIADFQQSNVVLGRAMSGLLGYSERYPEIKATNFADLQAQLEGQKIGFLWRGRDSTRRYRATTVRFSVFRACFGQACFWFRPREYFESAEESKVAPSVMFDS